jgi:pimeloyl-ACP methyl ester carboxylesterase
MLSRIADRVVLCPTRNGIPASHKSRRIVSVGGYAVEVWIERTDGRSPPTIAQGMNGHGLKSRVNGHPLSEPEVFILKFNGTGGRAEQATIHPLDFWSDIPGEVWSPNPPGYGASGGRPSLRWLAPTGRAVLEELVSVAGSRPIIVTGNSLGTAVALHVAASAARISNLAGMVLRNPPPLRELIAEKYSWKTLGLSRLVARHVPRELDSVLNAGQVRLPCVFLCADCDRVVPPRFQELIRATYGGEAQVVAVPDADHVFELARPHSDQYAQALSWLRQKVGLKLNGASAAFDDCNLQELGVPVE